MSNLILPQKWTSQPQTPVGIDWGNPITRGIISVQDASGVDHITGMGTFTGSARVNKYSPMGRGVLFGADTLTFPLAPYSGTINDSLVWVGSRSLIGWAGYGANNGLGLTTNGSNLGIANQHASYTVPNTSWPTGIVVAIGVISGQFSGSLWLNGIKKSTSRYTTPAPQNVSSMSGASDVTGLLSIRYARQLNDSEVASLSANPWQIFKAQQRRIWVGAAGGTNTAVNPGTGSIAITGYAPSIAQTANQAITPNVGNIVITGYAPTISQPQAVNPGVGSLVITGYAPTVTQNVDVPVNPGVGTIAITGYAPTVAQTANQSVLPATGTIAITGYSPTVSQSANQAVTPDVGTITITGYAPIVQQAPASQNITPDVGTITITGYAPTVEQSSPLRLGGFEYSNKVYIKRNKKIYIFDSVEEADSYLEAEAKAEEIVQQSNKTSRLARKRAREKAFKSLAIEPVDTVDIPALKTLVSQLQTDFELPKLIARQDWQRVVEIYQQAMEMQDEEDLLLIL